MPAYYCRYLEALVMQALIDGDIVAYRVACTCEDDDSEDYVFSKVDDLIDKITFYTDSDEYKVYLTGSNNFRKAIYPEYKAHRPTEKPFWLQAIRDYLVKEFNAEICDGQEADDAMGIAQYHQVILNDLYNNVSSGFEEDNGHAYASDGVYFDKVPDTIICTIDKDLLMIPGQHYNFVKDEFKTVTFQEGLKHFYMQCLQGDRSDNIKGIPGIGPKKAEQILRGCETEQEMFQAVRNAYGNDEEFLMNGRVLWIRRDDNEDWKEYFDALIQE
jgi:DNA polymerase I